MYSKKKDGFSYTSIFPTHTRQTGVTEALCQDQTGAESSCYFYLTHIHTRTHTHTVLGSASDHGCCLSEGVGGRAG